ncbi:MAG: dephospho-CoA kinase [Planctomycetota bacterium]
MKAPPKPTIGILGGIGSGKSTVAAEFARQGGGVIDADAIVADIYADLAVVDELVAWWGDGVRAADGSADRKAIGRIVFGDAQARARLEALIHPRVHAERQRLRDSMSADPAVRFVVEDTPLLLEAGLADACDALVFVDTPLEVRQRRVRENRGWSADELARREAAQASLDIKRSAAQYSVQNDAGPDALAEQVRLVLSKVVPR